MMNISLDRNNADFENEEKVFSPDGDAMLGLGVPDATNAVKEEWVGQGWTEHVAWPVLNSDEE